jgi:outer membrane protein
MRRFLLLALLLIGTLNASAQGETWTLERCVQYALEHNISIKQNELNARLAKLTLQQSQLAQIPSLNGSAGYGRSFGRSVNPVTNQFEDAKYDFLSLGANTNVLIFGWFQQRNLIKSNRFSLEASKAELDQLKNDVSLNVANGFLRAVLAKEQININKKQVELSLAQLAQTRAFVQAGRLPEYNQAQLQSQVASDSANLIGAISNYNSALLDMRALLNLDFSVPFDVTAPEVKVSEQIAINSMDPAYIYAEARKFFGSIKGAENRLYAAEKSVAASKGALYPNLSINGQIGSNWASTFQNVTYTQGPLQTIYVTNGTNASDSTYFISQPTQVPVFSDVAVGRQLNTNLRQTISLNLNIPIFNSWQAQYNLKQAKINYQRQQYAVDQAEITLKQNVYIAYNEALNSVQKYYAAQRANEAAQDALGYAQKRHELGLINTVEYLVTQNTANTSASNFASAKYDLIFKLKVIDYYLGKELKL